MSPRNPVRTRIHIGILLPLSGPGVRDALTYPSANPIRGISSSWIVVDRNLARLRIRMDVLVGISVSVCNQRTIELRGIPLIVHPFRGKEFKEVYTFTWNAYDCNHFKFTVPGRLTTSQAQWVSSNYRDKYKPISFDIYKTEFFQLVIDCAFCERYFNSGSMDFLSSPCSTFVSIANWSLRSTILG